EILRYLEVPPRDAQPVQIVTGPPAELPATPRMRLVSTAEAAQPDGTRRMPDLGGKTLRQALEALEPLRVDVRLVGQGRGVRRVPARGRRRRAAHPGGGWREQVTWRARP